MQNYNYLSQFLHSNGTYIIIDVLISAYNVYRSDRRKGQFKQEKAKIEREVKYVLYTPNYMVIHNVAGGSQFLNLQVWFFCYACYTAQYLLLSMYGYVLLHRAQSFSASFPPQTPSGQYYFFMPSLFSVQLDKILMIFTLSLDVNFIREGFEPPFSIRMYPHTHLPTYFAQLTLQI